jgi:hypothetical protein
VRLIGPSVGTADRDGLHALRGVVICGLALSNGSLSGLLAAVSSMLAGRAFAAGLVAGESAGRRSVWPWTARIAFGWLATFSPVLLVVSPEVVRSWAAAAALTLALRRLRDGPTVLLAAGLLVAAFGAAGASPTTGLVGELGYALGATWPRGWSDVARLTALFLLGGVWARRSVAARVVPQDRARARGLLAPLAALGSMPLSALVAHSVVTSLVTSPLIATDAQLAVARAPLACALLLVEMLMAHRWLQARRRGPAEQALHVGRAAFASIVMSLRRSLRLWLFRSREPAAG